MAARRCELSHRRGFSSNHRQTAAMFERSFPMSDFSVILVPTDLTERTIEAMTTACSLVHGHAPDRRPCAQGAQHAVRR